MAQKDTSEKILESQFTRSDPCAGNASAANYDDE